ncbi:hypothetical protein KUTeg_004041, partial [Tegillarca granosa]
MRLKPSDVYYCQDSINNVFDHKSRHRDVPPIQVWRDVDSGKWFSADNRRLWVFKNLHLLGKCDSISVIQISDIRYILDRKFTTINGGTSIIVRRDPGGKWYKVAEQRRLELKNQQKPSTFSGTHISRNVANINKVSGQLQLDDEIDYRHRRENVRNSTLGPEQEVRMS